MLSANLWLLRYQLSKFVLSKLLLANLWLYLDSIICSPHFCSAFLLQNDSTYKLYISGQQKARAKQSVSWQNLLICLKTSILNSGQKVIFPRMHSRSREDVCFMLNSSGKLRKCKFIEEFEQEHVMKDTWNLVSMTRHKYI